MLMQMENKPVCAANHEEACRRVASRFHPRWLQHYVGGKLRGDPVFRRAYHLLGDAPASILDVGCGVGLLPFYLRERGVRQRCIGVDFDGRKIRKARDVAAGNYADIEFLEQDAADVLPQSYGNVALFDVLHYLPPARQAILLSEVAKRVAPGGMVLLRDCPRDASLRFWLTYLGEIVAQAITWNAGVPLHFPQRETIMRAFNPREFSAREEPMWGNGPLNNRLYIFRRAVAPAAGERNDSRASSVAAGQARDSAD